MTAPERPLTLALSPYEAPSGVAPREAVSLVLENADGLDLRGKQVRERAGARVHRVGRCVGFTLWSSAGCHVELWVCREGVAGHRHPGQRVEVLPFWGWARFWRRNEQELTEGTEDYREEVEIGPGKWGRWFTIPAGWEHGFELGRGWLVFVNRTFDGRSAADNHLAVGPTK